LGASARRPDSIPFAGYDDHADCVAHNRDKNDPDAYCASIRREIEGKSDQGHPFTDLPDGAKALWVQTFAENFGKNDGPMSGKAAWASVYRRWFKGPSGAWAPLKAFEDIQFKSLFKTDRIVYGTASLAMVDKDNQLITEDALRGAFRAYLDRGHVLFYHKNIPVGEVLPAYKSLDGKLYESKVSGGALNIVVRLYKDTKIADEVWKEVEDGRLRAFSIGGEIIGETVVVHDGQRTYERVDRLDLHEISIVPEPANMASYFDIIKSSVHMDGNPTSPIPTQETKKTMCEEHVTKMTDIEARLAKIEAVLLQKPHEGPGHECPPGEKYVGDECVPASEDAEKAAKDQAPIPAPAPEPREKQTLVPEQEKGGPSGRVDWSKRLWNPSEGFEGVARRLSGK